MKDLLISFDKVRWHKRYDKISSLCKVLRYRLIGKDSINSLEVFINFEEILKNYDSDYLFGRNFSEEEISAIIGVLTSFQKMNLIENEFTLNFIALDRDLNITKCNFMVGNYDYVIESTTKMVDDGLIPTNISQNFHNYSKYSWRLIAEIFLCSALIICKDLIKLSPTSYISNWICLTIEILYSLIRFQETILTKRIKTSTDIYSQLLNLMWLAFSLHATFKIKNKISIADETASIEMILKNINLNVISEPIFIIPTQKLMLSLGLFYWFAFDKSDTCAEISEFGFNFKILNSSQPTISQPKKSSYCDVVANCLSILKRACASSQFTGSYTSVSFSHFKHNVLICSDILVSILSQLFQYDSISCLILKYLSSFFEDPYHYFLLACSLFASCHYVYSLQTCYRILEFSPLDLRAKYLILNMLINIFKGYDKAIVLSTHFVEQEPFEVSFYHSRAVAYLEKSIESLSLIETIECLNFAKTDILKAVELDDNDHEIYFYASLIFAFLDEIDTALVYSLESIKRSLFDSRPYNILFLLLVYKGLYDQAIKVLADSEREFPCDFGMILNKISFEQHYYGPETALLTVKNALELWNSLYSFSSISSIPEDSDTKSTMTDHQVSPEVPIKFSSFSRFNKDRYRGLSMLEERFKPTKTNFKILLLSPHDVKDSIILLILLFQKLAEICLAIYDTEGLSRCINDITALGYTCPEVFLIQAKYYKFIGEAEKCKEFLETALYLEPNHVESLYHLTLFFLEKYERDKFQNKTDEDAPLRQYIILAEENARRLVKVAPKNFISWQCLGKVLHEVGSQEESSYCLGRALELEKFSSILPFKTLFRRYKPSDINI